MTKANIGSWITSKTITVYYNYLISIKTFFYTKHINLIYKINNTSLINSSNTTNQRGVFI